MDNSWWKNYETYMEDSIRNNENKTTWINKCVQNENNSPMMQVIVSFVWGILLAPWSAGMIFLAASIILFEIFIYVFTKGNPKYYNTFVRTGVICSSVLGFIVGRTLSGDEVCKPGID